MKRLRIGYLLVAALMLAAPLWAYVTSRSLSNTGTVVQQRWKSAVSIPYRINPTKGANVTGSGDQSAIFRASFASWQALTTATISFAEGATTAATVKPGFDQVNLITSNITASDYASSALGLTIVYSFDQGGVVDEFGRAIDFPGQIVEADIMFNPSTQFSIDAATPANRIDLQSVATHEIGHFLGLDHTSLLSSVMFPTLTDGASYARTLSADDIAGISTIYPSASFATKGSLTGTVRTTGNVAVYGAIVTAVNSNGQPVASAITDTTGKYTIAGLDAGSYTVYAEPLDQPITASNVSTLARINPGATVFTNFTTRFR